MDQKTRAMQQFEQARESLRAELAGIEASLGVYPEWTIKEVLAHLAGWDDATILALQTYLAGDQPRIMAIHGVDSYNEQTVAERTLLDYGQIVREWELVRENLTEILEELPEAKMSDRIVAPWGEMLSIAGLIVGMAEHEMEHAEAIHARKAVLKS